MLVNDPLSADRLSDAAAGDADARRHCGGWKRSFGDKGQLDVKQYLEELGTGRIPPRP